MNKTAVVTCRRFRDLLFSLDGLEGAWSVAGRTDQLAIWNHYQTTNVVFRIEEHIHIEYRYGSHCIPINNLVNWGFILF